MVRSAALNVSLTPPLRNYVHAKVKSGRYESASEVIRDALRALQDRERGADHFWSDVRAKVKVARKQVDAGETVDGEAAMKELLAENSASLPARKRKRKSTR